MTQTLIFKACRFFWMFLITVAEIARALCCLRRVTAIAVYKIVISKSGAILSTVN